jgi:predicted nuclease with TOPRIM domain
MVYLTADSLIKNQRLLKKLKIEVNDCVEKFCEIMKNVKELEETRKLKLQELEATKEKVKKLKGECKKLEDSIVQANIIEPIIVVDSEKGNYSVANGLMDLNRDILMKLLKMMSDEDKTRNVNIMFYLLKHSCF